MSNTKLLFWSTTSELFLFTRGLRLTTKILTKPTGKINSEILNINFTVDIVILTFDDKTIIIHARKHM